MTPPSDREIDRLRDGLVAVGRRLYDRGLVGGAEGNISVRIDAARVLATPSGVCKGFLEPESLVVTDLSGVPLSTGAKPSSELKMHLRVYHLRDDVRAVVHAHPPVATGFAIAGQSLNECVVPELVATLGWVPVVPYGTPSTEALADQLGPYIQSHEALLLANHGAVTYAASLDRAINIMESLEQAARSMLVARVLGRVHRLSRDEVDTILNLDAYGSGVRNPGCAITDPTPLSSADYPMGPSPAIRQAIAGIVRDALGGEDRHS